MLTSERFLSLLRDALDDLYEPHRLRDSPLAPLFGVGDRYDTPAALQRILIEAIEALKPGDDGPARSRAWQIYDPLFYRYVERLSQREVADQIGLSERHLRRKEHASLQALASALWERFQLDVRPGSAAEPEATARSAMAGSKVQDELAWLKEGLQEGPTDLGQCLPGVLDLARQLAERSAVQLEIALSEALPPVVADPVSVRQTLLSLLSVAIPRASGGQVAISATPRRWEVELRVCCGEYPSGPKPALESEAASLNAAKQIADLAGGSLALSVDARGFDASLTLPAIELVPVLVIDDNVDTLQLFQRYASGTRYRLVTSRDPEAALALAEQAAPEVIVLDVMMPRVDGWEVLGRLRQHPLTRQIPVIVCTILPQEEWARLLGASAFMRKPVSCEALLAALDEQMLLKESESR